jgi:nitrogen-specific signal transduction histidine kinase/CheY-like chemotaxis protein
MKVEIVTALESAAWPVLLVNAGAVVFSANAAARHFFGVAVAGARPLLEQFWPAENGCAAADFFVLWGSSPTIGSDLKFRGAGGVVKNFSTVITCIADEEGEKFLLQLFPPSEVPLPAKKIGAAIPAPTPSDSGTGDAALKQKLDCVLQLARTVSLDMNNALTGVLAHTSRLLDKAEPGHPWRQSLLEVEKSSVRAAEISAELAVFSRREKEPRQTPPGNLNSVVSRCADFFRNAHGGKFDWRLTQESALFGARFDEAKLQQALTKIFENAVESFAPGKGGLIAVETRNVELSAPSQDRNVSLAAGNYVCVGITDTGLGMAEEICARVFEPFFTTKTASHRGLGLALVYGIITNHGGGVAISSLPGQGTSVRVYLPAEKNSVRAAAGPEEDLRGSGNILVVDDERLVLTMAETILSDFGYKVLTANSGQSALALLARPGMSVDMLITDLVMPGMGGRELVEHIRRAAIRLPVLCMSGYVMPAESQTGADYLQKPFTSRQLLGKVKAALSTNANLQPA